MSDVFEELIKEVSLKPRCCYPLTKSKCMEIVDKEGDRCNRHANKREKKPCKKCGKLTSSFQQYCHEHILLKNR